MNAKTRAQIQAAYRARKAQPGLKEVRGIWLAPELHSIAKAYCKALHEAGKRAGK